MIVNEDQQGGSDAQVNQALDVLPKIGKLLFLTIARYPGVAGRSMAQVKMLTHLHHSGSCSVGELAEACGVSMSAASEVVDRLVDDELITRRANPLDRRQVLLAPTEAARQVGADILDMRSRQVRTAIDRLAPEHRAAFVPVLDALAATLQDDVDHDCCATGEPSVASRSSHN